MRVKSESCGLQTHVVAARLSSSGSRSVPMTNGAATAARTPAKMAVPRDFHFGQVKMSSTTRNTGTHNRMA